VKTISLKKVSAVAVASLGFGLLSVVPVNAAVNASVTAYINASSTVNVASAGAVALSTGQTGVSYTKNTAVASAAISALTVPASSVIAFKVTGVGTWSASTEARVRINGSLVASTLACTIATVTCTLANYTAPSTAGTYAMELIMSGAATSFALGDTETLAFTLTTTALAGLGTGTSSAFIIAGNGTTAPTSTSDALAIVASKDLAATNAAAIEVISKNTSNVDYTSVTLSATLTGPGYLSWVSGDAAPVANSCSATPTYSATIGRSISAQSADALGELYVCASGDAGTATVTVSLTDTVSKVTTQIGSTKTITFYGAVAKLELVKSVWTNIRSGGNWQDGTDADTAAELRALTSTKTQSVTIKMTDSAGRVANSASEPTVVPGNSAVIAQGVCGLDDNADTTYSTGGTGYYNCGFQSATSSKSGDKDTVTIRIADPADATKYLTVTVNLTIGGSVSSEVMTTDKTSYLPGEAMKVTITAKDSAGNPAYDGAPTPSSITASKSAIGLPSAASFYVAGTKTYGSKGDVFAPALGGSFTLTATGTSSAAPTITASSSVTDGNAGLLTQIDALNAKVVALNALIAKIMKKLGVK